LFTYRNTVGVLLTDALSLGLSLLEGMLVLELASHFDGVDNVWSLESTRLKMRESVSCEYRLLSRKRGVKCVFIGLRFDLASRTTEQTVGERVNKAAVPV